eukprot:gnl/TRDRNA2_/TRDRNA2_27530_c0_seq1.p1 gnl/TRDRNA2_/TRDRNA2_27530_c0~~gnl/TRDRNA2_/TRDRNA2_27530_c0_seq1.p1  ORF type:complete len:100 (+),score=11.71 gnl/TRDRNA2_/TRDRNA2_27530_c0_seq1:50-349(+)
MAFVLSRALRSGAKRGVSTIRPPMAQRVLGMPIMIPRLHADNFGASWAVLDGRRQESASMTYEVNAAQDPFSEQDRVARTVREALLRRQLENGPEERFE